jgi:hypothetical protein
LGPPRENTNAVGHDGANAGAPRGHEGAGGAPHRNTNAEGHGAPRENTNAEGHGAPRENTNAEGHGAPRGNTNAVGHDGSNAGAPLGVPHRGAKETKKQIDYDDLINEFNRKASCKNEPFDVPIDKAEQTTALIEIAKKLKEATRIVACAVCGTSQFECDAKLLTTTTNLPPPLSWTTHLANTVNSILIKDNPDQESLRKQYRVPNLTGMHDGWQKLLLCPQGIYQVTSEQDSKFSDMFVFPRGSFMDMHVGKDTTPASLAKACVCTDCNKSLRMLPKKPLGSLPQLAIANDLVIGARILFTTSRYILTHVPTLSPISNEC